MYIVMVFFNLIGSMTLYFSTHLIPLPTYLSISVPTIPVDILGGTCLQAVVGEGSASLVSITVLPSIERGRTGTGTELRKLIGTAKTLSTVKTQALSTWSTVHVAQFQLNPVIPLKLG